MKRWENRWEQQVLAFSDLIDEARQGRRSDETPFGLDPATEAPFFDVLAEEMVSGGELEVPQAERLAACTRELVARLADKARRVGF